MTNQNSLFEKKVIKTVFLNQIRKSESNRFNEQQYHDKNWLMVIFGEKDPTSQTYLANKSRMISLASEVYRIFSPTYSPKYRPCFFSYKEKNVPSFLTKKINHMVNIQDMLTFLITPLNMVNIIKELGLTNDDLSYIKATSLTSYHPINTNIDNIPPYLHQQFNAYHTSITTSFANLKTTLEKTTDNADKAFDMTIEALLHFEENIRKSNNEWKKAYEAFLLSHGLPEIIAIAYFLGDASFKAHDLFIEWDRHNPERKATVVKLDHERCLFSELVTESKTDFFHERYALSSLILETDEIDNFPHIKNKIDNCMYWPFDSRDTFFTKLSIFSNPEFKNRSYEICLLISLIPIKTLKTLPQCFFDEKSSLLNCLVNRQKDLINVLFNSKKFKAFLSDYQLTTMPAGFNAFLTRWKKETYPELQFTLKDLQDNLLELKNLFKVTADFSRLSM
jgi:hypothetical protein